MLRVAITKTAPTKAPTTAAVMPSTNALMLVFFDIFLKYGAGKIVNKLHGRNVANAATKAPQKPTTKYPIKATVITTGPGVIIATATASTN